MATKLKELGAAYVLGIDFEQQPNAIDQAQFAARTLGLDVEKEFSGLNPTTSRDVHLHTSIMENRRFPAMRFVEGRLDGDASCWSVPNVQAVTAIYRKVHDFVREQQMIALTALNCVA